jgi:hypothetical protein
MPMTPPSPQSRPGQTPRQISAKVHQEITMRISTNLRKLIMVFLGFLIMLFGKLVEEYVTKRKAKSG